MLTKQYLDSVERKVRRAYQASLTEIPKRTGNLREKATRYKSISPVVKLVYIDMRRAPYADYANEKGKSAGYWSRYFKTFAVKIAMFTGGRIVKRGRLQYARRKTTAAR